MISYYCQRKNPVARNLQMIGEGRRMDRYSKERMREEVMVCVLDGDEVDAHDWLRKLEVWLHTARSVRLTCWLDASHLFMNRGLMEGWIMGDLDRPFGC